MRHYSLLTLALAVVALGQLPRIHLQWAICEPDPQTVLRKLGEDGTREPYKDAPVTYYDTDPPTYTWGRLMFRTKTRRDQAISAVKVRFDPRTSNAAEMAFGSEDSRIRGSNPHSSGNFHCAWDRYGDEVHFACAMQSPLTGRDKIWSDEQILFVENCETVAWDSLVGYGPNFNPKWRLNVTGHPSVFDDVQVGQSHFMELEVKVFREEGDEVFENITRHLRNSEVRLCDDQKPRSIRLFEAMGYHRSEPSLIVQPG